MNFYLVMSHGGVKWRDLKKRGREERKGLPMEGNSPLPWPLRLKAAWAVLRTPEFFLVTPHLTAAALTPTLVVLAHEALEDAAGDVVDEMDRRKGRSSLAKRQWNIAGKPVKDAKKKKEDK